MEASLEVASRLLGSCVLFRDLEVADIAELAGQASLRRYSAGETIFHMGDPGESMMGIVAGTVRVARITAQGDELVLADFGAGDVFGEIALLDGRGRSATASAVTNCTLVYLSRTEFLTFLGSRPDVAASIIRLLCGKLRTADDRSSDLIFLSLGGRLAKALLARAVTSPAHPGGRVSLSQSELATMIGATRSNVNRQLKAWERAGIVAMTRGWIVVLDRGALAAEVD
ncbi:MAG: Crp/Fnr family transcriptional regulator [Bauldia sp.]|nr:Crp/Fnr family transcriptional regulator [Bauldia sp.]MCW5716938.1 Crp/Fnr family transcriptional regulator [Bauldia sp.]